MKKIFILLFFAVEFLSCSNKKYNEGKEVTQDSIIAIKDDVRTNGPIEMGKARIIPNYEVSSFLFDTLSDNSKVDYVNKHKKIIGCVLLSCYDKYAMVTNIDSIFKFVTHLDFTPQSNTCLIPFYIHVLAETLKNNNVDGYVGETIVDICFSFFSNFPGFFYQYLHFVDESTKESLMNNIVIGLYYNDIDEKVLDSMFYQQQVMLPEERKNIFNFKKYVESRKCECFSNE